MTSPPTAAAGPPNIDQRVVRRLFTRADRIQESAFLRREVASRMRERLALVRLAPRCILDAGCGDGSDAWALQQDHAEALVVGVDASPQMLDAARRTHGAAGNALRRWLAGWQQRLAAGATRPFYMAGDFAALPLSRETTDLVWSNLALHWHSQPDAVLCEWHRVLRTDGLLMFSCFGPDTFKEVRAALEAAGEPHGVLAFTDMHDLGDMLVHAGFSTPVMDMETITLTYPSSERLLRDVRAFGGNPLIARRKGLMGKGNWQVLLAALDAMRSSDGLIHLTVEVLYGHAFVPVRTRTVSGEAIVRFQKR